MRFDVVLASGEVRTVEADDHRSARKLAAELYGEDVDHVEDAEEEDSEDDFEDEDDDEFAENPEDEDD